MKAAVLREVSKPLTIEDISIDKPRPREVLMRTVAAGVCHSDLHFIEGRTRADADGARPRDRRRRRAGRLGRTHVSRATT